MEQAYVHNIDPFFIQFTENFGLRWYGMAYLLGFIAGYWVIYFLASRGRSPIPKEHVADFVTFVAIGTLLGGRFGYALFYSPHLLVSFESQFPFWGMLKVNQGGMASHGGIIGITLACLLYAWWRRVNFLHTLDLVVVGGSLGVFFGRIANFINGELYGRAAPEGFAWAVKFPQEMYYWLQDRAMTVQLEGLAPAAELLGRVQVGGGQWLDVTRDQWLTWVRNYHRDLTAHQAVYEGIDQIVKSIQAGHSQVTELVAPLLTARYPSQLFQSVLEGLLVFIVLVVLWIKPRKPGVVAATFGVLYAVARIVGEQFRLPDAHIGFQALGLTRGQWLSIVMLIVAILMLWWTSRRTSQPLGGWRD